MKLATLTAIGLLASVSFGMNVNAQTANEMATATVIDNNEVELGTIDIKQAPEGVLLHVDLEGLPAGKHGFHIHQTGTCADNEDFKDSGGHIGKGDNQHGLMNPEGYEEGDLPNLIVAENGEVEVELYVDDLQITGENDDADTLMDADGSAFMIHENADDHMTQPIGGAGARIACGVIGNAEAAAED